MNNKDDAMTDNDLRIVQRTGREPLRFRADVLACLTAEHEKRAHRVTVYATEAGSLVLAVSYLTEWGRERDRHMATVCRDKHGVLLALDEYDPEGDVTGFPRGDQFKGREAEVRREVVEAFDALVSRLCDELGWHEWVD